MNKFSNKTIEQLAEQSTKSENCIDLDVITTLDVVNDVKPLDSIGVFVDTYLNFRPFLSDVYGKKSFRSSLRGTCERPC